MQNQDNKKDFEMEIQTKNPPIEKQLKYALEDIRKASSLLSMAKGTLEDTLFFNVDYFYQNDSTYNHRMDIEEAYESIDSMESDLDSLCDRLENEK